MIKGIRHFFKSGITEKHVVGNSTTPSPRFGQTREPNLYERVGRDERCTDWKACPPAAVAGALQMPVRWPGDAPWQQAVISFHHEMHADSLLTSPGNRRLETQTPGAFQSHRLPTCCGASKKNTKPLPQAE